jgi:hypothetical protein
VKEKKLACLLCLVAWLVNQILENNLNNYIIPDTLGPKVLVQASVDSNVGGAHLLLGKLFNFGDASRGSSLEAAIKCGQRRQLVKKNFV